MRLTFAIALFGFWLISGGAAPVWAKPQVSPRFPNATILSPGITGEIDLPVIEKLEAALEKNLTAAKRQQITRLTKKAAQDMLIAQERFVQEVARITRVSSIEVRALTPSLDQFGDVEQSLIPALEKTLGRSLSENQRTWIERENRLRAQRMPPIRDRLILELAKTTGLPASRLRALVPPWGEPPDED